MKMEIKKHSETGEDLVEITDDGKLIATVIPRQNEIVFQFMVVSKYICDVVKSMSFPAAVIIRLNREV